jgi:hypothetical protein
MAWIGMRPVATSWPPARRIADANGAAHEFSQTNTPAMLPGSIASAIAATSSSASSSATFECAELPDLTVVEVGQLERLVRSVGVLAHDEQVEHAHEPALNKLVQRRCHLPRELALPSRELDHHVVDRPILIHLRSSHDTTPHPLPQGTARPDHTHAMDPSLGHITRFG